MTHTPPIPAGNQSPYPLQEPPHKPAASAPPSDDARVAKTPEKPAASERFSTPQVPTLVGIAAGIGLAAIAGGLFYAFRDQAPKKRKKRKAPKHEA
jgi:hypothetical protein